MWILNLILVAVLFLVVAGLLIRLDHLEARLDTNDRLLQATLIDEFKNEQHELGNRRSLDPPD